MRKVLVALGFCLVVPGLVPGQDRDTKVRNDRKTYERSKDWIYNNLEAGSRVAKASGKPLLVIFRCIPCEACQQFDDDVARRDPVIRDLMDQFVCVRIVQANTMDLAHFQFDFDQSFAAFLMNSDLTIYGRFGTRSERAEAEDMSLEGLRKAMEAALRLHGKYAAIKSSLSGKQVAGSPYKTPRDYPSLVGKYGPTLDYEGKVARSCIHCHQIREAERRVYRSGGEPIPDPVLFPYPDPGVVGLTMDPKEMATVKRIAPRSRAERAGLRPGDAIATLGGQPLLSVADLQWVLHNAPAKARIPAEVTRDGMRMRLALDLEEDWRRGDISWRATTWDLRRMGLGGMRLQDLSARERREAGLSDDVMALRVRWVGEFGDHAVAKRAGVLKDDLVVAFDGKEGRMTESEVIAHSLQRKRPGDQISLVVLRGGEREPVRIVLQ